MSNQHDQYQDSIDQYLALSTDANNTSNHHAGHVHNHSTTDNVNYECANAYHFGWATQTASSSHGQHVPSRYADGSSMFQPRLPNFTATANPQYLYNYQTNLYYDVLSDTYSRLDEARMIYETVLEQDAAEAHAYYSNEPSSDETLRMVVLESQLLPVNNIVLVDANGITVGRDRSWDRRLRLPEMAVSKYHCHIFSTSADIFQESGDAEEAPKSTATFSIIDVGSQNGTFVNGNRLSVSKAASSPAVLKHMDVISVGTTKFQVHDHQGGWPCEQCKHKHGNIIDIASTTQAKPTEPRHNAKHANKYDREQARRDELKRLKQKYHEEKPVRISGIYVDRADARRKQQGSDYNPISRQQDVDMPVTPIQSPQPMQANKRLGEENIGNRLLQRMGWKEGQGLGSSGSGMVDPIQPEYRQGRAGLGATPPVEETYHTKGRSLQMTRKRYNELS
ncbi:hypothetical protein VKS41_006779 [Umbelopsis sp. WA50703]